MTVDVLAVVEAWQNAASAKDVEGLLAVSDPNIEVVGPRGSAHGHQILREWIRRAGLQLHLRRAFVRGDVVVVEQDAVWHSVETGAKLSESVIASVFHVADERVTYFSRHETLESALEEAELTEDDAVPLIE